jgi:polar amino acid transport system substrate-binding protein
MGWKAAANLPRQLRRMARLAVAICAAALCADAGATGNTFTIGVEDIEYYPLHSVRHEAGKDPEYIGFAREVLDAFAREHGYTFKYQALPINRLFELYFGGDTLDFKYPDNPQWQAARREGSTISYSTPIVVSQEGALVQPAHKGRALREIKVIGTMLGFTPWPYIPAIKNKAVILTTSNSFDGLLRHAIAGHIDALYMNVDVANYQLAEQLKAPHALVFDPALPHASSAFSLSTRRHHDIVAQFNQFLQRQRPLLQQLRAKYKIAESESY